MFDLRALSLFASVAETRNISRAAEINHLSQSALSRQIQALEEALSFSLFDRSAKRLLLTAEGESLLPRVQALLAHANELAQHIGLSAQGQTGLLRIGATPQTIESLLSRGLVSFRKARPSVEVRLQEGSNEQLIELVELGKVHVAIANLPQHSNLDGEELFRSTVTAVLLRDHKLAAKSRLDVRDLRGASLLLPGEGFTTRALFDSACARAEVRASVVFESSSTHTLSALAEAGHGIAIVSSAAYESVSRKCVSVPLSERGRALEQSISVIWNPRAHKSGLISAFVEHMRRVTRGR